MTRFTPLTDRHGEPLNRETYENALVTAVREIESEMHDEDFEARYSV